jgi:hypothetical protein
LKGQAASCICWRLKIAESLKLWGVLREELQNLRSKQNPKTSHVSF